MAAGDDDGAGEGNITGDREATGEVGLALGDVVLGDSGAAAGLDELQPARPTSATTVMARQT
ncbi:MAG TPA: hypothetical protein VHA57_10820 [Actinomycetota bacterium]|nr:hypothetical protein [Actinomycetota bacterium]